MQRVSFPTEAGGSAPDNTFFLPLLTPFCFIRIMCVFFPPFRKAHCWCPTVLVLLGIKDHFAGISPYSCFPVLLPLWKHSKENISKCGRILPLIYFSWCDFALGSLRSTREKASPSEKNAFLKLRGAENDSMNTAPASNITEPFICLHHDSYISSLFSANLKDEYQKHDVSIFFLHHA